MALSLTSRRSNSRIQPPAGCATETSVVLPLVLRIPALFHDGWGKRFLDMALRDNVPVSAVEELLLHVVVQAGARWAWWMLVVEDELRCVVMPRLQEAHHLAGIDPVLGIRWFSKHRRLDAARDHFGLEVGSGANLGDRQICRVAERIDTLDVLDLQGVTVRWDPPLRIAQPRILDHARALMRRDHDQQVIGQLLALQRADHLALGIRGLGIEEDGRL